MVLVLPNAGGVGHDVRDVVLLVDAVEEVGQGALGKDSHVFAPVCLQAQGDSGLGLIAGISCRGREGEGESAGTWDLARAPRGCHLPPAFCPRCGLHKALPCAALSRFPH